MVDVVRLDGVKAVCMDTTVYQHVESRDYHGRCGEIRWCESCM